MHTIHVHISFFKIGLLHIEAVIGWKIGNTWRMNNKLQIYTSYANHGVFKILIRHSGQVLFSKFQNY